MLDREFVAHVRQLGETIKLWSNFRAQTPPWTFESKIASHIMGKLAHKTAKVLQDVVDCPNDYNDFMDMLEEYNISAKGEWESNHPKPKPESQKMAVLRMLKEDPTLKAEVIEMLALEELANE